MTIEKATDQAPDHLFDLEVRALRDTFAGQAMAQFLAAFLVPGDNEMSKMARKYDTPVAALAAKLSYQWADAMLAARTAK